MNKKIFVTGTDTGVGKTYVSALLLRHYKEQGLATLGIKPLASGCFERLGKLYSEDALILQQNSSVKLPYEVINPLAFGPAIAPHIAAEQQQIRLGVNLLKEKCLPALDHPADVYIVEGAGGWYMPLNASETLADFVAALNFEVILVVGMRLGCLNHAILTHAAILQKKVRLSGWIANCIDTHMQAQEENITTLRNCLSAPCLGVVKHLQERLF